MNLPRLSIITPSFNQGQFLEATIQSVLGQNYPNLEYIIIDGGSTDRSVEIIRKYERQLKYWVSEKDRGQSHAFNKGLSLATGEIIGWLNSDDLYLNRAFLDAADHFRRHPSCDIVFSDYLFIDENNRILRHRREIPFNPSVYIWTEDCYHANCAGFFRQGVFAAVGGLNEALHYGMDYEFYLRAAQAGCQFSQVRKFWGAYRLHAQSKSIAAYDLMTEEGKNIFRRFRPGGLDRAVWYRRPFWRAYRLTRKCCTGAYLPLRRSQQRLPAPVNG